MLYLGHSNGSVAIVDCLQAKIIKTLNPFKNHCSISQIKCLNSDKTKLLLLTADKYVLYDI